MSRRASSSVEDNLRAAFAIDCRKVRLYLAANPGSSAMEIKQADLRHVDMALNKMLGMKIVKCERGPDRSGRTAFLWYVIPQ